MMENLYLDIAYRLERYEREVVVEILTQFETKINEIINVLNKAEEDSLIIPEK